MFNIKRKILRTIRNLSISRSVLHDFFSNNRNTTLWNKNEPFHIKIMEKSLYYPNNPYQNAYVIYEDPLTSVNPFHIYIHNAIGGDLYVIYRDILLTVESCGRFQISYNLSQKWKLNEWGIILKDMQEIFYVSCYGDVITEYVSGKYDKNVYELLNFLNKNDVLHRK